MNVDQLDVTDRDIRMLSGFVSDALENAENVEQWNRIRNGFLSYASMLSADVTRLSNLQEWIDALKIEPHEIKYAPTKSEIER